jgi:fucose 4-O-acetylase-like acetyltransferase
VSAAPLPFVDRRRRPGKNRELYIDAFRGVMALLMVQGHIFDDLLSAAHRALPMYQFEVMFHGSTAPGFLFASGFVAGLPRAPLSVRAMLRRARRLLFVLGVGYFLHLPYLSLWKTAQATAAQKAELFACNPLQLIAVSQLALLLLQWIAGRRWVVAAAVSAIFILAAAPFVWSSGLSRHVPLALGAYLDPASAPSQFPIFPFAAFVLAGTVAGAWLGRTDRATRRRRSWRAAALLVAAGLLLSFALRGRVDFWTVSPGYALLRMGGLVIVLAAVEWVAQTGGAAVRALGLIGHETLVVYVLHLLLLFGGVVGRSPLAVLVAMVPVLYAAAWVWHRFKMRRPHGAQLTLAFLTVLVTWELLTRPW